MNESMSISFLTQKIDNLIKLTESKSHLSHPEDLVFLNGSAGANNAVNSLINTVKNPGQISIKWDGYPALIFGRDPSGKFSIMDKHMFDKKDGSGRAIYSPEMFARYDQNRGVVREQLTKIIAEIWSDLEKSHDHSGYYWGDLLFAQPLTVTNDGMYRFKANPNGIEYSVNPKSKIGMLLNGKNAGIAVHQFIPAGAMSTNEAQSLNGNTGRLKNNNKVAIVPSKMPIVPKLGIDTKLIANTQNLIKQHGPAVDKLISTAPQAASQFSNLFTTYINKKVASRNLNNLHEDFNEYFANRNMTNSMKNKLSQHLGQNQQGVIGAFTIWAELYKLKMALVDQLSKSAESAPVQGRLADGTNTQEGFVSQGVKLVDRLGFSAQNFAARK